MKIKNLIPWIILFMAFNMNPVFAQNYGGLIIGTNIMKWSGPETNVLGEEGAGIRSMSGIYIAVPFESRANKYFAISQEIGWSQKGAKLDIEEVVSGYPVTATARYVVNYMEYIGSLKGIYPINDKIEIFALAGPTLGLALGARTKINGEVFDGSTSTPVTVKEKVDLEELGYNRFDYGISLGGGVAWTRETGSIFLAARYQLGLMDKDKSSATNAIFYNRGLNIVLGMLIK